MFLKLFDPVYECVFDLDFSYRFSKLQHNGLAFVAGLNRAIYANSSPEMVTGRFGRESFRP